MADHTHLNFSIVGLAYLKHDKLKLLTQLLLSELI